MNKVSFFILSLFIITFKTIIYAEEPLKKASVYFHWKHQFEFAGYYIAKEKGFYEELGLDVDMKQSGFRSKPRVDIVEKDLYTFATSSPTVVVDKANGKKVVAIGAIFQSSPHVLVSLKSSNIKSIKDFKNKTIMMNNKLTQTASFISMMNSEGVSLIDMKRVDYTYKIDSLIKGVVDIAPFFVSNQIFSLKKEGLKYDIWDPKDYGFDFYNGIIYTGENTLKHDPTAVKNFKKATIRGFEYAFNNIEETVDLILKKYNTQNKTKEHLIYEATILKEYAYINNIPLGDIDKHKMRRIHDVYHIFGLMENRVNIDEFVYKNDRKFTLTSEEKKYLKNKKTIKMCINPNLMPFEKLDEKGIHIGITADYFKIFKQEYKLPIKLVKTKTWSQTLNYEQTKKCDILSLAMETAQKKEYLNFTKAYLKSPLVLATKVDIPFITDFRGLKKEQKIGIPKEYGYIKFLKVKYPNLNIVQIQNNEDGLKKVIEGELFGYIDTLAVIGYMFQTKFTGELKVAGKFDQSLDFGIGVTKDNKILLGIFNNAIKSIPNEIHQKIFNKWIAINYNEDKIDYELIYQILLAIFIIVLFLLYRQHLLKKSNIILQQTVDEKTKELVHLNKNLESKIEKATFQNRKKDQILYKQSKMVSMGEMIGNIAHQWRQPLNEINSNVVIIDQILRKKNLKDKQIENEFTAIENQTEYLSTTIADFQNFLMPSDLDKEFNIKDVFEKNMNMFGKNFTADEIKVVMNLDDIFINGSENKLLQVTINILNNAKDAFKTKRIKNKYIFIYCKKVGNYAVINIKDNAGGIKGVIQDKIFDAYFTTKDKSKGTGLGLYMSYQIILNKFYGELTTINEEYIFENNLYKGASFIIKIPISLFPNKE